MSVIDKLKEALSQYKPARVVVPKPTIEELEKMIGTPNEPDIRPDGSVRIPDSFLHPNIVKARLTEAIALLSKEPDPQKLLKEIKDLTKRAESAEQDWQLAEAENKKLQEEIGELRNAFIIFIKGVERNAHSMSYEKMNPTLDTHFNHLCGSITFAKKALTKVADQTKDGARMAKSEPT